MIDFRYTDEAGQTRRFRRDANVQTARGASEEAAWRKSAARGATGNAAPQPSSMSFKDFVDGPFEREFLPTFRPATRVRYESLLRSSVLPFFGAMPLASITQAEIRAFAGELRKRDILTKGPVTLVRTVLRAAVDTGRLAELPSFPRQLAQAGRKLPDAPSVTDFKKMLAIPGWLGLAVALAGLAGLRMGEVRALQVRDVDLENGRLLVRRALSEDVSVSPKSGNERVVPLVPLLADRLRAAIANKQPEARVVLEHGRTPRRQDVLRLFKQELRRAGQRERSFHSLRHFFISELVRRGAGLEAVRTLAGHSKLDMTQRYAHANADDLRATVNLFAEDSCVA